MGYSMPNLPRRLGPLIDLAGNLRWNWHPPTRTLFESIDEALWGAAGGDAWRLLRLLPASRAEALAADEAFLRAMDAAHADLLAYLGSEDTWFMREHGGNGLRVAYLSAEFGLVPGLRIYSGGLGVLAGDHLKSASDEGLPLVGIGLFYPEGYFQQCVDSTGRQQDTYDPVDPAAMPMSELRREDGEPLRLAIPVGPKDVFVRVWQVAVGRVPLYLIDANVPENGEADRRITDRLYSGDSRHRIRQELLLGIGAVRLLEALGQGDAVLHLNEGHAAFAALERARMIMDRSRGQGTAGRGHFTASLDTASRSIVFTTHTPVEAGHDYFPPGLVEEELGPYLWSSGIPLHEFLSAGRRDPADAEEPFCMTILAIRGSSRRNGVSELHGHVSRRMWAALWPDRNVDDVPIGHITNGVHLGTWTSAPMVALFERHIGESWADSLDEFHWHGIDEIPDAELWEVRNRLRQHLIERVRRRITLGAARGGTPAALDPDTLTVVFARRFATYKRTALLLAQPERLAALMHGERPVQFIFAGKAHPRDEPGKNVLRQVVAFADRHRLPSGRFVFLEDYDLHLAQALVHGADIWLNLPIKPYEASGTSGMKAAANGGLNLSVPDGWWAEAVVEHDRLSAGIGWAVDPFIENAEDRDRVEAGEVFRILEQEAVPLFHDRDADGLPRAWLQRVRASLRQLPPFFNTHRMVRQYATESYMRAGLPQEARRASGQAG